MSLVAEQLGCARNDVPLFAGVNFTLAAGQALRIAGANGVGKTTLLKIITCLRRADIGQLRWQNQLLHKSDHYRQDSRFLGHKLGLKAELTVAENWRFAATMYKTPFDANHQQQLITELGLPTAVRSAYVGELSAGQQRRVAMARLQIGRSKLWVLDEAFVSLDTAGQALLTKWISSHLAQQGMLLFTAHHDVQFAHESLDLERHCVSNA